MTQAFSEGSQFGPRRVYSTKMSLTRFKLDEEKLKEEIENGAVIAIEGPVGVIRAIVSKESVKAGEIIIHVKGEEPYFKVLKGVLDKLEKKLEEHHEEAHQEPTINVPETLRAMSRGESATD